MGHPRQDSHNRTVGIGHSGPDNLEATTGIDQPEQFGLTVSLVRTERTGRTG
jgi:hypothetical protein